MSVATSAVERLQDVAGRAGAITEADERATATELNVPVAAVHGAATFYDDLARTRRGSRHVRVCEGTACFAADGGRHIKQVEQALGVSAGSRRDDSPSRCRQFAALASATPRLQCWAARCRTLARTWPTSWLAERLTRPLFLSQRSASPWSWQALSQERIRGSTGRVGVHLTDEVLPGQVFLAFHLPDAAVNELTSGWTDEVTSCPEYKVTAVSVQPA